MGPGVVMMENYCLVSGRIFRAFFSYCSLETDSLCSVAFSIDGFTLLIPPNTEHYLRAMDIRVCRWFGWLAGFHIWFFALGVVCMFGILERWNNNQITPSLIKPHELSYRFNIWPTIVDFGIFNIPSISRAVTWRSNSIMALFWSSSSSFGRPECCSSLSEKSPERNLSN